MSPRIFRYPPSMNNSLLSRSSRSPDPATVDQQRPQHKRKPDNQSFSSQQDQGPQRIINFEKPDHVSLLPLGLGLGCVFLVRLVVVARVGTAFRVVPFSTTPTSDCSGNSCRALRAISEGVALERTTISTPSHALASTLASETGMAGGESMMIQSNSGSTPLQQELQPSIATSSAGSRISRAAGNEKQVLHRPALHDRELVTASLQIVGEARRMQSCPA